MTSFDYVVLAVVGLSLLIGLLRGAVTEVISLAGWVAAVLLANRFAAQLAAAMKPLLDNPSLAMIGAYILIVLGSLLAATLLKLAVSEFVKVAGLRSVDRLLGLIVGAAKGVLLVLILVLAGGMTTLPQAHFWRNAASSKWFETLANGVKPWLPREIAKRVQFGQLKV
jgi:membrane protein required for colicin V production